MEEDNGGVGTVTEPVAGFVGLCPYEQLPQAWPLVREYIQAALAAAAQHEVTIEHVEKHLGTGEYCLLLMQDGQGVICGGAVLTKSKRPDGQVYVGTIAVGGAHLDRWSDALAEAFKTVARAVGASEILMLGRPGWRRALAKYGVRERGVILSYEV